MSRIHISATFILSVILRASKVRERDALVPCFSTCGSWAFSTGQTENCKKLFYFKLLSLCQLQYNCILLLLNYAIFKFFQMFKIIGKSFNSSTLTGPVINSSTTALVLVANYVVVDGCWLHRFVVLGFWGRKYRRAVYEKSILADIVSKVPFLLLEISFRRGTFVWHSIGTSYCGWVCLLPRNL